MTTQQSQHALSFSIALLLGSLAMPPYVMGEPSATPADAKKTEREPIYDENADGERLLAEAILRARAEGKRVLIEWGGNWCGWCHKLHDVFKNDELVAPIVSREYELVLIDCTKNRELMESYGGKDTRYAFPHLTILDVDGKVLTNQETGSLEVGSKHDPEAVAGFLKKWQPEPQNAADLLQAALRQAASQEKRVLLHVGTPTCGWCKILSRFLTEHESILSQDFVDLRIDTVRMHRGEEVAARFLPANSLGVPWMVILDASGKVLSTSVSAQGNIGYPVTPPEIKHFMQMMAGAKQRLKDQDLDQLRADLDAFRIEYEQRLAARKQ
jgi:thioredoxin-related protein